MKSELVWALLPFTMGGRRALENAFDIVEMVENQSIPGDIVECGVARGGTAAMLSVASLRLGTISRRKWLFDSYEGLPEPTIEDYVNGKAGNFIQPLPKGSCLGTLEQVSQLMYGKYCFSRDDVVLVEGWFQDTVPQYKNIIDKISILRLDGDWYESTKIPLDNFFDKIVNGGFVIVDDYATCFGSRKATDEFRAERGIETPLIPDGRGGVWFQKKS